MIINVTYGVALAEVLNLSDPVATNAALLAYVVNANTYAVSNYRNYNFNSMAKIGNRYFGAGAAGISELTGGSDNGVSIDATVRLPVDDFDSDHLKRVPEAYLGVSTAGSLMLQVIASGVSRYYTVAPVLPGSLHTGRLTIGKGLESRYWEFELTNVSGVDFTIDSIAFNAAISSRRIKER